MARRSDHSRAELAQLVLQAARSIVLEEGARAVTMRGIATRIGYAPGSIYNAVGDIESVLLRINAATLGLLADRLASAVACHGSRVDPIGNALLITRHYLEFVAEHRQLWAAIIEHPPRPETAVPDWYAAPRARLVEIAADAVAPLFPEPAARARTVAALWASLQGIASLAAGGNLGFAGTPIDPQDIARSLTLRYLTGKEEW